MNTLTDTLSKAFYKNGFVFITLLSGVEIKFPIKGNQRLEAANEKDLTDINISPLGLHWEALDEDLSLEGILSGDYGQSNKTLDSTHYHA